MRKGLIVLACVVLSACGGPRHQQQSAPVAPNPNAAAMMGFALGLMKQSQPHTLGGSGFPMATCSGRQIGMFYNATCFQYVAPALRADDCAGGVRLGRPCRRSHLLGHLALQSLTPPVAEPSLSI